jgi:F-type H+/Na+-transporting ATPase subunit alpha
MKISADEITEIIKKELAEYQSQMDLENTGTVVQIGDGIAKVYGLTKAMQSEMLLFPGNLYGLVLNLEESMVGVVMLGDYEHVKEGDIVQTTGRILEVPVGPELMGRVINPLGLPLDDKGPLKTQKTRPLEGTVPNVVQRQMVKEPLQTGILSIDSMIPIGRGQRELILGDRGIGKTALAIDTIINQKDSGVRCIYVAIGQRQSIIARLVKTLRDSGALEYTTVVVAGASDLATLQYLAPYAGASIGEDVRDSGGHALVVYDDLTRHAWAYRQISLLLRRPPGREAYPGDVFYLHSRLLERAAKLSDELGGGSLTAIPIIETQAGDVSAYIPTNVISITDGQIILENDLFYAGVRPAINPGLSVSRVGGHAQIKAMKQVAGRLRLDLAQFREMEKFAQFGTDLDKATQSQITRGQHLVELLKQGQYSPLPVEEQIVIINSGVGGFLDDLPLDSVQRFGKELVDYIKRENPEITQTIKEKKQMDQETLNALNKATEKFKEDFFLPTLSDAGH